MRKRKESQPRKKRRFRFIKPSLETLVFGLSLFYSRRNFSNSMTNDMENQSTPTPIERRFNSIDSNSFPNYQNENQESSQADINLKLSEVPLCFRGEKDQTPGFDGSSIGKICIVRLTGRKSLMKNGLLKLSFHRNEYMNDFQKGGL